MARRPEFYFDEKTGYYRKRVKLQSGAYKDVRAKSKEELRAKLYDLETAQRMGSRAIFCNSISVSTSSGWGSSWMTKRPLPSFWHSGIRTGRMGFPTLADGTT